MNETSTKGYFAHETAVIDDGAIIGRGSKIWHFTHVMPNSEIGERCNIGQNCVVLSGVKIGNNVKIQNNVSVYTAVAIEDDVFLGPSMVFTNVVTPRSFIERKHEYLPTMVRRGATIGANATIVCGVTIGEYALIGSGAVVTKDIPAYALAYGNPSRVYGWVCRCGVKLPVEVGHAGMATCHACNSKLQIRDGVMALIEKGNYLSTSPTS